MGTRLCGCAHLSLARVATWCGRIPRSGGTSFAEAAASAAVVGPALACSHTLAARLRVFATGLPFDSLLATPSTELRSADSFPRAFIVEPALASAPLSHPHPHPVATSLHVPVVDGRGWGGGAFPRVGLVSPTALASASWRAAHPASSTGLPVAHPRPEVGNPLRRGGTPATLISIFPLVVAPLSPTVLGISAAWLWAVRRASPQSLWPPPLRGDKACLTLALCTASCALPLDRRRPAPYHGGLPSAVPVFGKARSTHRVATSLPLHRPTRGHIALALGADHPRLHAPCHEAVRVDRTRENNTDVSSADLGGVAPPAAAPGRLGKLADGCADASCAAYADFLPHLVDDNVAPAPGLLPSAVPVDHRASPTLGACVTFSISSLVSPLICHAPDSLLFVKVPPVAEHIMLALTVSTASCPFYIHGASIPRSFAAASISTGPWPRTRRAPFMFDDDPSSRFNGMSPLVITFAGCGVPLDPDPRASVEGFLPSYGPSLVFPARLLVLFPPRVEPPRNPRKGLPPATIRFSAGLREFVPSPEARPSAAGAVKERRAAFRGTDAVP